MLFPPHWNFLPLRAFPYHKVFVLPLFLFWEGNCQTHGLTAFRKSAVVLDRSREYYCSRLVLTDSTLLRVFSLISLLVILFLSITLWLPAESPKWCRYCLLPASMYSSSYSLRCRVSLRRNLLLPLLIVLLEMLSASPGAHAVHHMKRAPIQYVNRRDDTRPLKVTNTCPETIYPGIATQAGTAPKQSGFKLNPGDSQTLSVSADWQGRVWGRTNCSFNSAGTGPANNGGNNGWGSPCFTGDCGGVVNCMVTVCGFQSLFP